MQNRLGLALVQAALLHAGVGGLMLFLLPPVGSRARPRKPTLLDLWVSPRALSGQRPLPADRPRPAPARAAGLARLESMAALAPAEGSSMSPNADELSVVAPPSSVTRPTPQAQPPRRAIDLGIQGPLAYSTLDTGLTRPRRRNVVALDGWSEHAVRAAAERRAPKEGSAIVRVEWDRDGRLLSVTTGAHSSDPDLWRAVADVLRRELALRPPNNRPTRGLRLTYLVEAKRIKPKVGPDSTLPEFKNTEWERIDDPLLPPAYVLKGGIRADTSDPGRRVVTVTLTGSEVPEPAGPCTWFPC